MTFVLFVHVYTCVFVVVFMHSLFYRFNILVFHRECFHLHHLTTSIFIYKQHFFFSLGGGTEFEWNMGIKCLRIEKCVLCAYVRVNLKVAPLQIYDIWKCCHTKHFTCCYDFSMIKVFKKIICKIKKAEVLWIVFLFIQYIPTFVYWLFKCPKCTFDISCFIIWLCQFVLT